MSTISTGPGVRLQPGAGGDQLEEGGADVQGWGLYRYLHIYISTLSTLSTLSTTPQVDDYLTVPADVEMVKELGISHDKERSLIPLTTGLDGKG